MDPTAIVAIASAGGAVLGALVVQIGAIILDKNRREEDRNTRSMENQNALLSELLDLSSQNYQQLTALSPGASSLARLIPLQENNEFYQIVKRSMRILAIAYATGDSEIIEKVAVCLEPLQSYLKAAEHGEFSDARQQDVMTLDDEDYRALWGALGDRLRVA